MLLTSSAFETMKNELESRDQQILDLKNEIKRLQVSAATAETMGLSRIQRIAELEGELAEADEIIRIYKIRIDKLDAVRTD